MENVTEDKSKINNQNVENDNNTYNWGLDLIRVLAMFFVILVHSTSFYGFVGAEISSFSIFMAGIGRYLSYTCIPLFLILTGYLNSNKKPCFAYYIKLLKIVIEFILCAVVILIINRFCFDYDITLDSIVPNYSWYINMYIGLFLLAPFLNYLYHGIPDKYKWGFIITLLLIFSYPHITSYWTVAYPIMFYFIGSFLKDKQFKIKKYILLLGIVGICIVQTILAKLNLSIYSPESHNNIGCVVLSVAIFLLLYDLNVAKNTKKIKVVKPLRIIANASLSTFLISEIFESLTANMFANLELISFADRLPHLTYLTPLKFIASIICGLIISFIAVQLYRLALKLIEKCSRRKNNKN